MILFTFIVGIPGSSWKYGNININNLDVGSLNVIKLIENEIEIHQLAYEIKARKIHKPHQMRAIKSNNHEKY